MQVEGVIFCIGVLVGDWDENSKIINFSKECVMFVELCEQFDVVVFVGGSEMLCDLLVLGCELNGIYYVMEFLLQ